MCLCLINAIDFVLWDAIRRLYALSASNVEQTLLTHDSQNKS